MPEKYLILGGRQHARAAERDEWFRYEAAIAVVLDISTGDAECVFEHVSPDAARPGPESAVLFKAGTIHEGNLFACTQTEVIQYDLPSFEQINYWSLPCFNDVHHVTPAESGDLLIASTGLDAIVRLSREGKVIDIADVLGEQTWELFDPEKDYRKVPTTKPHRAHPNFVFECGGETFATRFNQKDAISLSSGKRFGPFPAPPHDGISTEESVFFTTIDGRVIEADASSREIRNIVDLREIAGEDPRPLGWCRGVCPIENDRVLVGFSRIRKTRLRQNLQWIAARTPLGVRHARRPARVSVLDLRRNEIEAEFNLEETGLSAIFSIHSLNAPTPDPAD